MWGGGGALGVHPRPEPEVAQGQLLERDVRHAPGARLERVHRDVLGIELAAIDPVRDSGHQPEDIAGLPVPVDDLLQLEDAVPHGLRAVRGLVSGNKGFALGD